MAATKKTTNTTTKAAKNVDRFGTRAGTKCSMINAVLTTKPKTVAGIAEALGDDAGVPVSLIRNHMHTLTKKGLIEKTDNGFKVAKIANKKATK